MATNTQCGCVGAERYSEQQARGVGSVVVITIQLLRAGVGAGAQSTAPSLHARRGHTLNPITTNWRTARRGAQQERRARGTEHTASQRERILAPPGTTFHVITHVRVVPSAQALVVPTGYGSRAARKRLLQA